MDATGVATRGRMAVAIAAAGLALTGTGCKLSDSGVAPPAGLVYAVNPAVYVRGTPIAPNSPSSTGGVVAAYAVSPPLPAGLDLNALTGVVTGTPTAVTPAATHVVTATNAGGSATVGISIAVQDVAPTGLTYAANPATYTVGVTIPANTPTSGGGAAVSWAVSPALPAGLALSATTGAITGTPTAVTARAAYRVTATNTGGSASVDVDIEVNALAPASVAYATNPAVYFATVPIVENVATVTGGRPASFVVSPALPNGLVLHPTTGAVLGTPSVAVAERAYRVTAANSGGSAWVDLRITVNPAPPLITTQPLPQTVLGGTAATFSVAASGSGALSYAWRRGGVAVPGATGTAWTTPGTALADDGAIVSVVVRDPQGGTTISDGVRLTVTTPVANVYVANGGDNTISQFTAGADGSLVPMAVPTVGTGVNPSSVVVHSSGEFAYVANYSDATISQYSRGLNGALTPLAPPTVPSGANPLFLALHPSGGFLYASAWGEAKVYQYAVGVDGTLVPLATPWVASGTNPAGLTIAPNTVPQYAFVANTGSGLIARYSIGNDGALSRIFPDSDGLNSPYVIAIDSSGAHAYVSQANAMLVPYYSIGSGGQIALDGFVSSVGYTRGVAIDPGGRWVYMSSPQCPVTGCDVVNQYRIIAGGVLEAMTPQTVSTGSRPASIAISPDSQFLWAANNRSNSASQFAIGISGALTPLQGAEVPVGVAPSSITAAAPRSP